MPIFGSGGYSGDNSFSSAIKGRVLIIAVLAVVSVVAYMNKTAVNPITGKKQHVSLSVDQEIALGMQSAPEMAAQFGGISRDSRATQLVNAIGAKLIAAESKAAQVYPFEFHLLADPQTINAFALPGGQIFITSALLEKLQTEGQLAGVLGHEMGHVIQRHSAQQMANGSLISGIAGAVVAGTSSGYNTSSAVTARAAQVVASMVNLKYGRGDELEADHEGLAIMTDAGYDPRAMIRVMEILQDAAKGNRQPEFLSTHPYPESRIVKIKETLAEKYPQGVPSGLKP
jgi:predicted Zn-dependent protease